MRALSSLMLASLALALAGCEPEPRSFEEPLVLGGTEVAPEVLNLGEVVFQHRCRGCHGERGAGDGQYAAGMEPRPANLTLGVYPRTAEAGARLPTDAALRRAVVEGIEGTEMGPQPLEGDPLEAVLQYIKTLAPVWRDGAAQRVQ